MTASGIPAPTSVEMQAREQEQQRKIAPILDPSARATRIPLPMSEACPSIPEAMAPSVVRRSDTMPLLQDGPPALDGDGVDEPILGLDVLEPSVLAVAEAAATDRDEAGVLQLLHQTSSRPTSTNGGCCRAS